MDIDIDSDIKEQPAAISGIAMNPALNPHSRSNKWSVMVLAIAMQMVTFGAFIYSFTFWVTPWSEEFGVSRTTVMIMPTLFMYATATAAFFLGKYIDTSPQRTIASIGLVAYAFSMVVIAFAPNVSIIFLVYAFSVPVACTLAGPIAAMAFISQVFEKGRGFALGLVTMGTSLGGMTIPNLSAVLIEGIGWRQTHLILGLAPLVLLPFILTLMRHKPVSHKAGGPQARTDLSSLEILKRGELWVCIGAFMFAYFVFLSIQYNMAPLGNDLGIDLRDTALTVTVFTFGMLGGKLLVGYVSDRLDPRFILVGICTAVFVSLSLIKTYPPLAILLLAFLLMGLGSGGLVPLKGALFANIFGAENVGRVLGVSAPFIAAYGIGPIYAAWVRDATGSYDIVLYSLMAMITLSGLLILMLRSPSREPAL